MFGPAGHAYVYLVYGMYDCLNVVTEPSGTPAAVLVRAVEPLEGIDAMRVDRVVRATTRRRSSPERAAREADRVASLPVARLASGPGLVAAAYGLDTGWTGVDLCDPSSPLRLETAVAGEPEPDIVATARIGVAYAGEPWSDRPWRFVERGSRSVSGPVTPAADRPPHVGRAFPRAARVPGHPGPAGRRDRLPAVATPGRDARAVERPGHRRARARRDRSGARVHRGATGRRHRRGGRHRAGDRTGGPRRSPRTRPVPRDRPDARCDRAAGHAARRRPPAAAARARPRPPRLAGPAVHALSQLRPRRRAAGHGLASPRRPALGRPGRLRAAPPAARLARRLGARECAPGADHHVAQRTLRGPGQGRGPVAGQGHRPRRVGERPDAVHRAARGGRARERLARGADRGGRGGRPHPRRAVGLRRRQRRALARDPRRAGALRPVGRQGVARGRDACQPPRDRATGPRRSCCRPATRG